MIRIKSIEIPIKLGLAINIFCHSWMCSVGLFIQRATECPGARGQFTPAIFDSVSKPKPNNPSVKIQIVNRITEYFITLETDNFIDINITDSSLFKRLINID